MVFLVQIQCCCHHLHSNKINVSIALLYYSQSSSKQCMIIIIQTLYQHENTTFCTQNFILLIFIILFYTCIILLSSPRAKRAGWPKASALASLARLLLDFIHPPPPLAQLGTTLKVVRASFWAVRRSKCILRG